MSDSTYVPGDWNANCSICGRQYKASTMVKSWKGDWLCPRDWEPRHPQDFVRGIPDNPTPPWIQNDSISHFTLFCTPVGSSAYPGYAIPGCMIPGYISPLFDPELYPN